MRLPILKNFILLALTCLLYVFLFQTHIDKILHGGDNIKHDIGAELIERTLFSGQAESINEYAALQFGQNFNITADTPFITLITDLKPIYLFYLSFTKLFPCHGATANLLLCLLFVLTSLYIMSFYHNIKDKAFFLLAGSLLLAPFFVYYCYTFEAHILQLLFTCLGVLALKRDRLGPAGFFLGASCLVHRSNYVLLFLVLLYLACIHRKRLYRIIPFLFGGLIAYGCVELFLFILFALDSAELIPHTSYIKQFFTMLHTASGVAKSPSALNFFKNSLVFLLLPTVALTWIKSPRQLVLTTLPFVLYFVLTKFRMPGAHRVLIPVYFLAYTYFLANCRQVRTPLGKTVVAALILVSLGLSAAYHAYALRCQAIDDRAVVSLEPTAAAPQDDPEFMNLRWNLLRYNQLAPSAPIHYSLESIPLVREPNIPDPHMFYPYFLVKTLHRLPLTGKQPFLNLSDPLATKTILISRQVDGYAIKTGKQP